MEDHDFLGDLKRIYTAALREVDPYGMIRKQIVLKDDHLSVSREPAQLRLNLAEYERILLVGAGKASARMAKAVEELLGDRISGGIVSVKAGHAEQLDRVRIIEAGHPVPNQNSVRAAEEIATAARGLSRDEAEKTLVIVLLSGGGSSLLVSPLRWREGGESRHLTLKDIQTTTDALLACGAPIQDMNCVRKHLSNITGGRLARLFHPATLLVLVLSDVVGDRLDTIASGPTSPDETTFSEAMGVIREYGIEGKVPQSVLEALQAGEGGSIEETPKSGDTVFSRVHHLIIGTNRTALEAAALEAEQLGYRPVVLTSRVTGEAKEVAKVFYGIAQEARKEGAAFTAWGTEARKEGAAFGAWTKGRRGPLCILAGGETTVTLRGGGRGGRNQELALSFLVEMERSETGGEGVFLLSASTDGTDGPTDAAGAFASRKVWERARVLGLDPSGFLAQNDSYTFFEKTGYLFKTGPTGTNVCDLQIILIPESPPPS